jgi:hypothetical protein
VRRFNDQTATIALILKSWEARRMPASLSSRVFLYPRSGTFPTEAALLELNSDNTIRLTTVDPNSGNRRDIVFDNSLGDIHIGGTGTSLSFATKGDRWRIDFSPYNAGQRVITAEQANREIFKTSDASSWAAKLRELGYPTAYRSTRSAGVVLLIIIGVAIATVAVLLLANLGHPIVG